MTAVEHTQSHDAEEHESMSRASIWKVFFILLGLTIVEFVIALAIPETLMPHSIKNILYIFLTLAKAFYIVAYFMHLKFEKIMLIYLIIVPMVLVLWIVGSLLYEGDYWLLIR